MIYTWEFPALEKAAHEDGKLDVVTACHWRLTATDDSGTSETVYGSFPTPLVEGDTFTPFADLTKAEIESWAEAALDVPELEAGLASVIAGKLNPVTQTVEPPWA